MKTPKQNTRISNFSSGGKPKYSYVKYAVFFIALVVAAGTGWVITKKHKTVSSGSISVPTAYASDIPGWWYQQYFGFSVCDKESCKSNSDPDKDGLTNSQEYYYKSNPVKFDTNSNGLNDGEDVAHNYDPSKPGKVTFDEAASDTEILGESLVFDQDIKRMINDQVDPNKVVLPSIPDSQINISQDNSKNALLKYIKDSNDLVSQNFPANRDLYIQQAMQSGDQVRINDVHTRISKTITALNRLSVPSVLSQVHRYMISFLTLLPDVLNVPAGDTYSDTDIAANSWFDKTQQALVLYQKIDLETTRIKNQIK